MAPPWRSMFQGEKADASKLEHSLDLPTPGRGASLPTLGERATGKRADLDGWRKFFDGKDVLDALQSYDGVLKEITDAARLPHSRFPLAYEKGFEMTLPHLSPMRKAAKLYALRAWAKFHAGQTDSALADLQTIFRLDGSIRDEPMLISQLVRMAICQQALQPLWEGLADHRWSEPQLATLQNELARIDFLGAMLVAFHGERAGLNVTMQRVIGDPALLRQLLNMGIEPASAGQNSVAWHLIPSGWIYMNMLVANRYYESTLFPTMQPEAHRVAPLDEKSSQSFTGEGLATFNPYTVLARLALPALSTTVTRAAYTQTSTDEALIACALERFRLANGHYPDTLQALAPAFLQKFPCDVMTGEPLRYRVKEDGSFLLYSVGSDGTDDGGKVMLKPAGNVDISKGDWVWSQ